MEFHNVVVSPGEIIRTDDEWRVVNSKLHENGDFHVLMKREDAEEWTGLGDGLKAMRGK